MKKPLRVLWMVAWVFLLATLHAAAQTTSTTVTIDSPSPAVIASFNAGDTVTISAQLTTNDPNQDGVGEPVSVLVPTDYAHTLGIYLNPSTLTLLQAPAA